MCRLSVLDTHFPDDTHADLSQHLNEQRARVRHLAPPLLWFICDDISNVLAGYGYAVTAMGHRSSAHFEFRVSRAQSEMNQLLRFFQFHYKAIFYLTKHRIVHSTVGGALMLPQIPNTEAVTISMAVVLPVPLSRDRMCISRK